MISPSVKTAYRCQLRFLSVIDKRLTSSFFGLLPQTLLKNFLFLEGQELLEFAIWMALRAIILRKNTISLCIEDDEALDAVEREIHCGSSQDR